MNEIQKRLRRLTIAPLPTEMIALLLATLAITRGVGVLIFDGVTTDVQAYCLILELAPLWLWMLVPVALGSTLLYGLVFEHCRARRFALLFLTWYWMLWGVLVVASHPHAEIIPFVSQWLVLALFAGWTYSVDGWVR